MEQELELKTSPKDIARRIKNIRLENKWKFDEMLEVLNNTKTGYTISMSTLKAISGGINEIGFKFLVILTSIGYNPLWVLTGLGEKKLTKGASTVMTDIHKFRVELAEERARYEKLNANFNQAHRDIEYLLRENQQLREEFEVFKRELRVS